MSFLNTALQLAEMGFHVFPLKVNSKLPIIKDYPNVATRDPDQIKKWWINNVTDQEYEYNVGISTTKFGDNESLVVIDVDNKNGKNGTQVLADLDMLGKELPVTMEQITPTGGRHLIFSHTEPVKQGTDVLGKGLDIRSRGGYIVATGSKIDGKFYTGKKHDGIKPCPRWVVETCGLAPEPKESKKGKKYVATEYDIERAIHYLSKEAPESIKGQSGDQTAYRVVARVKDFGISKEHCLELMLDYWYEGSGWSAEKLKVKIDHAYLYGKKDIGEGSPATQFEKVETAEDDPGHYLKNINKEYALVYVGGSHSILHETIDEKGRPTIVLLSENTFKRRFSPFTVQKHITYAEEWLDWAGRREYKGLCFAPERDPRNGFYNMWKGFICKPLAYEEANETQKRGFDMFIEHARKNVCKNDEGHFQWLMGYFAHLIQKPYERPLTTLVFQGKKGVGKNALIDRVGALLGNGHYLVAHDSRYLTSNFNGHLDSCLCLVLDEAFWSGDKAAEGKLKGISTAPEMMIERKGKEPYMVDNLVRLIIIGNDDWLVPASADERRYAVFAVGEDRKKDIPFFTEMRESLDLLGGNRVLLDYFQKFDLSTVEVNSAPATDALAEQKVNSLEPFEKFWHECLVEGTLTHSGLDSDTWPWDISKEMIRNSFERYCKGANIKSRLPDLRLIGKIMKKVCPSAYPSKKKLSEEGPRENVYRLPLLPQARAEWDKAFEQTTRWDTNIFD